MGILSQRGHGSIVQYAPIADALFNAQLAIYELLGDAVRALFAALHLRQQ